MFRDRVDAGERLADALTGLAVRDPIVLGLPRGGVAVAAVVARSLGADLDVLFVRKVGAPHRRELALAAVAEDGVLVRNEDVLKGLHVPDERLASLVEKERAVLAEAAAAVRTVRPARPVAGRDVIVVDDGIATGATVRAACQAVRARGAARVVVAAPVASTESVRLLQDVADEVVCVRVPPSGEFGGVGRFYRDFAPVPNREVLRLLSP